jgi:hypothetical protein
MLCSKPPRKAAKTHSNYAAELALLFDPTPASPGGDGLLTIGPSYIADSYMVPGLVSAENSAWTNGYADPVSTVKDKKLPALTGLRLWT